MLTEGRKALFSEFLISCFYSVLSTEERSLESITNGKLTLKEIHLIDAVFRAAERGENNFSNIANRLKITLGTLTSAFNKLEKKGYLTKVRDKDDHRIFYIVPTRLAEMVNGEHRAWHNSLVEAVIATIPEKDMESFAIAVKNLAAFFENKANQAKKTTAQ